jgi:GT2 family glycosyltransferase
MYLDPSRLAPTAAIALRAVVAIPARDEARHLPACLRALADQRTPSGALIASRLFEVVVFANGCSDGTAEHARALAAELSFALTVVEGRLPVGAGHAGEARRMAMDLALARLEAIEAARPVILTTDADSRVPPNWIHGNCAAIDAGADAVLGRLALDEDGRKLPEALHRRGALESEYEALITEVFATLDPVSHNPWPHHSTISGASLAVTAEAYRRIGGLPRVALGEDKALVAELLRRDARVRFDSAIEVVTSARLRGRAIGGVADTLRLRARFPDSACDDALESYRGAERRAHWRGRLRRLWADNGAPPVRALAEGLAIPTLEAERMADEQAFGAAWAIAERTSPLLRRRLLRPSDLPREIATAREGLSRLKLRLCATGGGCAIEAGEALQGCDSLL